jgi:tetratricopeptide (TPR) repeat protein
MEKAHYLDPLVKEFALGLGRLYFDLGEYDRVEPLLSPFADPVKPDFQLFFLLGSVNQRMAKYDDAVKYYRSLIVYHGLNMDVLNSLASCYYNLGNPEEARKAWEQSLKLDPNQEKVKEALKGLKNETSNQKK